jgi:predicted secreted protein
LIVPFAALVATAQQPAGAPAGGDAVAANAPQKLVTDAHNGADVTLNAGEVLVVRLNETAGTGYSRALVTFPEMPIRLISHQIVAKTPAAPGAAPRVGGPKVSEWRFAVDGDAGFDRVVWLKLLHLRPFDKGVDTDGLWEVKVTVPKAPPAAQ